MSFDYYGGAFKEPRKSSWKSAEIAPSSYTFYGELRQYGYSAQESTRNQSN